MYVAVCVYVCTCVCACACVSISQRKIPSVFFTCSLPYFMGQGLSLNLELTIKQPGWPASPRIFLSLAPRVTVTSTCHCTGCLHLPGRDWTRVLLLVLQAPANSPRSHVSHLSFLVLSKWDYNKNKKVKLRIWDDWQGANTLKLILEHNKFTKSYESVRKKLWAIAFL